MKRLFIIFIVLFLISCSNQEDKLKTQYLEVVKINVSQFITVDSKGNIHLVSANEDEIIIYYQDIELCLIRNFTKEDKLPSIKKKLKNNNKL